MFRKLTDDPILFYIDETGDHSLEKIDNDFPLFVLTCFVVQQSVYVNKIIPEVYKLKIKNFGHEGIILHSRDIRKAFPPFEFLLNRNRRSPFLNSISTLMSESDFKLIVAVILKDLLIKNSNQMISPYEIAMKFILERIFVLLKKIEQPSARIIAESRGENEDKGLKLVFYETLRNGTKNITESQFSEVDFVLTFLPKSHNIIGTQFADLCGCPIGRYILNPLKENKSFEVIKSKIMDKIDGWNCFQVFP